MFTKLVLHHIFSILYYFLFFAIFTLFNFSSSSTIVFLTQSFIYSDHCFFFFFPLQLFKFSHLYILKFYNIFTLFNISSTPPFLFHFNFHINFLLFHFHPSSIPSKLSTTKEVNTLSLSLSLSNFVSLSVDFLLFQPFIFSANGSFCYC